MALAPPAPERDTSRTTRDGQSPSADALKVEPAERQAAIVPSRVRRVTFMVASFGPPEGAEQPVASIPFLFRAALSRPQVPPDSSHRGCNDRYAPSIEQCVFFDQLISLAYEYTAGRPDMAMDVTLRQLRAYVAVLEASSFSEAAKAMHLSQAALSGLIKELENRVGVRLLDRTTRKVSASTVGETFAPMARRVLSSLDEALDNLTNLKELRRGLVRVAAPETLSCTLLPELIAGYNNSYPGVDVRFDDVPIQEVLAGLQNGSTDIGFGPAGVVPDQSVEVHMICADPLFVALRSDDPLTKA